MYVYIFSHNAIDSLPRFYDPSHIEPNINIK